MEWFRSQWLRVNLRTILLVAAENFELKHIQPAAETSIGFWRRMVPVRVLAGQAADGITSARRCGVERGSLRGADGRIGDRRYRVGSAVNGISIDRPEARREVRDRTDRFRGSRGANGGREASATPNRRDRGGNGVGRRARKRAQRRGVPFYCIRAVSDIVRTRGLSLDLNAARDRPGDFGSGGAGASCSKALEGFPELLRLCRNSETASRALGEFIGNCSF